LRLTPDPALLLEAMHRVNEFVCESVNAAELEAAIAGSWRSVR
jgi:hypothetical protein